MGKTEKKIIRVLIVEGEYKRDIHLAEEETENGEGTEEDDEDIGDERDKAGIPICTVVVHQRTTYQHDHCSPYFSPRFHFPISLYLAILPR